MGHNPTFAFTSPGMFLSGNYLTPKQTMPFCFHASSVRGEASPVVGRAMLDFENRLDTVGFVHRRPALSEMLR